MAADHGGGSGLKVELPCCSLRGQALKLQGPRFQISDLVLSLCLLALLKPGLNLPPTATELNWQVSAQLSLSQLAKTADVCTLETGVDFYLLASSMCLTYERP